MKFCTFTFGFACLEAFRLPRKEVPDSAAVFEQPGQHHQQANKTSLSEYDSGMVAMSGCPYTDKRPYNPEPFRQKHMFVPESQNGDLMLGGDCNGLGTDGFWGDPRLGEDGDPQVQTLEVWTVGANNDSHLKAIRCKYHNGRIVTVGTIGGEGPVSFTFNPGEHLVGDVILRGDGHWWFSHTGYIGFETSHGRSFSVGMTDTTKYYFPSRGGRLSGFLADSGDSGIVRLGIIMADAVKSIRLTALTYPTLSLQISGTPDIVYAGEECNDSPEAHSTPQREITRKQSFGKSWCMSGTVSATYGSETTFSGSTPVLQAAGETKASWEVSASFSSNLCGDQTTEIEEKLTFPSQTISPYTRWTRTWTQWNGTLTALPYTATVLITYQDNRTKTVQERGLYKGVSYMSTKNVVTNFANVTCCKCEEAS